MLINKEQFFLTVSKQFDPWKDLIDITLISIQDLIFLFSFSILLSLFLSLSLITKGCTSINTDVTPKLSWYLKI